MPKSTVIVDELGIRHVRPDGRIDSVTWNELRSIYIETNSGGPFIEDVYCLLEGPEHAFYIPQGAIGFDPLMDRLFKLPGFDSSQFTEAMTCTDNAVFRCWKRRTP